MITGFITRVENVKMNYSNYKVDIIKQYNVVLEGWPEKVPFTPPSAMDKMDDVRRLLEDLRMGTCRWRKVTAAELKEVNTELEKEAGAGKKKRAERSDKGVARGPNARGKENNVSGGKKRKATGASNDDQPRSKKRKSNKSAAAPQTAYKSRELITDEDDDDTANTNANASATATADATATAEATATADA